VTPGAILVTGAGGFLGRSICARLRAAGRPVRAWLGPVGDPRASHEPAVHGPEAFQADICDGERARAAVAGVSSVVHLAGPPSVAASMEHPVACVCAHVVGTAVLLDALHRGAPSARLVYVSSAEVYGQPTRSPVDEACPCAPRSPYGAAKLGAEEQVRAAARAWGLDARILRPFSVYGPGASPASLVAELLAQAAGPGAAVLRLRDGRPVRDLVHVEDVAAAVQAALEGPSGAGMPTWNVGCGRGVAAGEVARLLARLTGPGVQVEEGGAARVGEIFALVADIAAIRRDLGWEPGIALEDGLAALLAAARGGAA
jgi:UDP-glucose 4-epimerase